ncbi:DUF3703 domain-containing protein [Gallaecimonas xiamenensis]|uniref:DUF3703 domain-containing protein n=1 Tax=Gallaecimonas xiamenensis 3-C-1 TaxID=745411 RepID=K2JU39_9GAMM|nr:DUF3703 domain-containing protein [Gallaecimonas xiamenensis]EKE68655.1 hypothetical protein B3C1_16541 [Gallaecimonas xiamenensis 3-C-1]
MFSRFARNIAPAVKAELALAQQAHSAEVAFKHLENAHVLGQGSTWWHMRVHLLMLVWAWRQKDGAELAGQLLRVLGAATKTALGWVPKGNTGGANVSPFKAMPLSPEHQALIDKAKG